MFETIQKLGQTPPIGLYSPVASLRGLKALAQQEPVAS